MYYTYVYLDPRIHGIWTAAGYIFDFEPFYVGKGSGKRSHHHIKKWSYKTKSHKNHRIKHIIDSGYFPIIIIVRNDMDEHSALELEHELILSLGTRNTIDGVKSGPLTNLKTDGVIQSYSVESKAKMSDSAKKRIREPHSEETKAKMRESNRNGSLEVRGKISKALKGKTKPESHRERMSTLHTGKVISTEQREKARAALIGRTFSDESKQKMTESQLCHWNIQNELTGEICTITDMRTWCKLRDINYQTFYGTLSRNKFHKGFKIIEKVFSPR